MTRNESYGELFSLLSSVLQGNPYGEVADFPTLMSLARKQSVVGLVCDTKPFASSALTQEMRTKCVGQVVAIEQ